MMRRTAYLLIGLLLAFVACRSPQRSATPASHYPVAVDLQKVGTYPASTKSGAGYFYDDVLEYRVWVDNPDGGDLLEAFPTYEEALTYSQKTPRAEPPLVLVRQKEWIDEPQSGQYIRRNEERITEWRVEWLKGSKRTPEAIERFLSECTKPDGPNPKPSTR